MMLFVVLAVIFGCSQNPNNEKESKNSTPYDNNRCGTPFECYEKSLQNLKESQQMIQGLAKQVNELKSQVDGLKSVAIPIGAIIAWHPDQKFSISQIRSDSWKLCDGSEIQDKDSPLNGQKTPNLNGEGRFLRGRATSGLLEEQDWKSFYVKSDHGPYLHNEILIPKSGYNNTGMFGGYWNADPIGANALRFKFDDSEIRPKNMSVVWIMRIK